VSTSAIQGKVAKSKETGKELKKKRGRRKTLSPTSKYHTGEGPGGGKVGKDKRATAFLKILCRS